jgi:hypothetical protein
MKMLTIHGAWSAAFLYLAKMIENRKWKPNLEVGERFALHASRDYGGKPTRYDRVKTIKTVVDFAVRAGWGGPQPTRIGMGADRGADLFCGDAIGLDDVIVDWHELPLGKVFAVVTYAGIEHTDGTLVNVLDAKPWVMPGQYQWQLEELILVPEPVACRGHQGLRPMPKAIEDAVLEQIL